MAFLFRGAQHAKIYQKYRPGYPLAVYQALLKYLAVGVKQYPSSADQQIEEIKFGTALDVGCGTGQSTVPLCSHFTTVIGVDISEAQLNEARKVSSEYRNLTYRTGSAHQLSFQENDSVDLVTTAQALHWMDTDKFYEECKRILRPGGVLAAYGYGVPRLGNSDANRVVRQYHDVTLNDFWESGRKHIADCYSELYKGFSAAFSVHERIDTLAIDKTYSLDDFVGYLQSWSAYQTYRSQKPADEDPLVEVTTKLKSIFSTELISRSSDNNVDDNETHCIFVSSPIFILLGRKEACLD